MLAFLSHNTTIDLLPKVTQNIFHSTSKKELTSRILCAFEPNIVDCRYFNFIIFLLPVLASLQVLPLLPAVLSTVCHQHRGGLVFGGCDSLMFGRAINL
jgi:hypothetical protein